LKYPTPTLYIEVFAFSAFHERGRTGFDGNEEAADAYRGPGPRKNLETQLTADYQPALAA